MDEYITEQCIIEEYLNNWFTFQELADYLCIPLADVENALIKAGDTKTERKIREHARHINEYYENLGHDFFISSENQRYVDIANYMIDHQSSIRQTADFFGLGKTTIYDYVHEKLPSISIVLYKEVFDVLTQNKSFSTHSKRVIEQVLTSYNLLMQGKSSEEIASLHRNVVQRNLTGRLKSIDLDKYLMAQEVLQEYRSHVFKEDNLLNSRK